jgi:uncharacterized protein YjeT (DUF2065 family)
MPEHVLRIIVGVIGGLLIATRLPGFLYPERVKKIAGGMANLKPGWIRFFTLIVALFGLYLLYSTLVLIFSKIPVFMIICFTTGLIMVVAGTFAVHPAWFKQTLEEMFVKRGAFFVRMICFLGLLGGIFVLLSAIFGAQWGGSAH